MSEAPQPFQTAEQLERELNARVAFEAMLAATLTTAAAAVPVYFCVALVAALMEGAGLARLASICVGALSLGLSVFLGGFVGALALGVPLFLLLEKLKLRRGLHYVLGGVFGNTLVFSLLAGRPPSVLLPNDIAYLIPGAAIALIFLRRIAPMWRSSLNARADAARNPAAGGGEGAVVPFRTLH